MLEGKLDDILFILSCLSFFFFFAKSSKRTDVFENNLFLVTDFYKQKLFHIFE